MAVVDLTLRELVGKSYARAVTARRFVKLVKSCLERREVSGQDAEDAVTGIIAFVDLWMKLMSISLPDALLHHLYPNPPSAVLLNYTSQAMSSSIITSRTFVIHLLFLFLEQESLSDAILASISNVILANPTGLEPGDSLPAALEKPFSQTRPVPDIATSTSANPEPSPVITASTLALLLPLLRICSLTASSPAPTPIINFTTRILSLLEPYPAPSLEVGLEAGNLLQSLPEVLAAPLRDCLSGLMADLTISQDVAQLGISSAPPDPVEISNITSVTPTSLTSSHSSPLLPQIFEFLLSYLLRSARWARCPEYASEPPRPPDTHIKLLRLGPHIASDPSTFLLHLIQTAVNDWGGTYKGGSPEGVPSWLFLTEGLPVLLRWWRDNSDPKWPFPRTLPAALALAFDMQSVRMAGDNAWLSSTFDIFVAHADDDDDTGAFSQPEGWMLCSVEVTMVHRMVELGLLDRTEAYTLVPNIATPPSTDGESLMNRLGYASKGHLIPLAHLITFAPGAARSFSTDFIHCLRACPRIPPPDGLFTNLASRPSLIYSLAAALSPAELLDIIAEHLLNPSDDRMGRADDPQGSLTRFGEGVVLVEAVVSQFQLPLPDLLRDARRALSLADLDPIQRTNMNGWIKALFGSDGIDDQILLATSPSEFCRLASGLVQQAIAATAAGQIELDTLHSGLSYFSQPLLSWSLGGVVAWLCSEIERNGLLSALHLNVLQTLLLDSSFPEPLLRVNSRAIKAIVERGTGIEPVLQSSAFNVVGVRDRLESISVSSDSQMLSGPVPPRPLTVLRAELQSLRHLDLRQPHWTKTLLEALESSLMAEGPLRTVELIIREVLQASVIDLGNSAGDPLEHFAVALLSLRFSPTSPMPTVATFILQYLPSLFDSGSTALTGNLPSQSTPYATTALARLIKQSLLATADIHPADEGRSVADALVDHMIEELRYQGSRPVAQADVQSGKKAPKVVRAGRVMSAVQKEMLDGLCGLFEGDEEMRSRWPQLIGGFGNA